tara:strand:+ start:7609 stop:7932 length:324 start_codon:yes stop_codon:yes gene_type:complete
MKILFFGPGGILKNTLASQGYEVEEISLQEFNLLDANVVVGSDLLIITDTSDPTGVLLCKEFQPDIKTIVYSQDDLPDFLRPQIDFALDPRLFSSNMVAEELSNLFS